MIQLRGTNATGKTTAIREFINHGDFRVAELDLHGRKIEYHWDDQREIAILGRYDQRVTGGIDGYITSKNELMDAIVRMIKTVKPRVLLFEGIVYGVTFKFAYDLCRVLKQMKCEYTGLCLIPPLEVALDRLALRNGDKPVDYMSVQNKWFTANRAYEKLRQNGIRVKAIDTSKIEKESMWRIIQDEI